MKKHFYNLSINLGLLISGLITIISGGVIQIAYHIGNHGSIMSTHNVLGINYEGWAQIHKDSIVLFSLLMILHFYLHWKWFKVVIEKRLIAKNKQVLILSVVFVLSAITGFIPWIIGMTEGNIIVRNTFVEIHDKLAIILTIFLIWHIIKRLKWFVNVYVKLKNS